MSDKKKYKQASRFLYWLYIGVIGRLFLKLKLRTVFDRTGLEDLIKKGGPALVLSSHISNLDFIFAAAELYPNMVTFVGSHHFTTNKISRYFLKISRAIPKKMFCADVSTIISIMRARDAGQIVVMYPEGRLTCSGKGVRITEGTAELVKKLGVDVYYLHQDGAYKSVPKWAGVKFRPGKVVVHGGKLFAKEDLKAMSKDEIFDGISKALYHDEDVLLPDVEYKCKTPAEGLHGILYKCPVCGETFKMSSAGDMLKCEACGAQWKLDNKYVLHGPVFDHINTWYDWEQEQIDTSVPIDSEVTVATPGEDGLLVRDAGRGHFHVDRDNITFKGEVFGKPLEFTESTKVITAFPASVRDHVSLYSGRVLYYFMPEPDKTAAVYWVQYLDKVVEEREKSAS